MLWKLLILFVAVFNLSACNLLNQIKMRYANDDIVANWPENFSTLQIKTHYIGEKPHVFVNVNGKEDFLFLVDTGASLTYLMDTPKVAALALEKGYELDVGGWGDEDDSKAFQSRISSLSLGGAYFENVNVAVIPVSKTKYYSSPDEAIIDGVLGHDILHHFVWMFDKRNHNIQIQKDSFVASKTDVIVPFDVSFSKLSIPVDLELNEEISIERDILIDTGSRHFFKLNKTFLDEENINLKYPSVQAADFGLSGRAIHQRITIPSLSLGSLELKNVKTNLIETDDSDDFWVIGSAILNQFITIVDYKSESLIVREYPTSVFKSRYNLLGLELRKNRFGQFVVRYVMPDMASASYDFQEKDRITSINDVPSEQLSQEDWLEITDTPDSYKICRYRPSDETNNCFTFESYHIAGYSNDFGINLLPRAD